MVQPPVLLGLDLGASKVVAVVAVQDEGGGLIVTGASIASSESGISKGEITDINLTVAAVNRVVEEAMRTAGQTTLTGIQVSVDGIQFKGENLRDSIATASWNRRRMPASWPRKRPSSIASRRCSTSRGSARSRTP
jgi:cell division protein FtsA